ncbi:MAG: ABC transporter ATP-binding protein [Opitutales bacterium]
MSAPSAVAGGPGVPLLAARDLTKIYPGVVANEGVDLDLWPGRIHAIIGENGAGKSTLVGMLQGAVRPERGTLAWQGRPLEAGRRQAFRALGIGFVPQHVTLVERFTVWENLVLNEDCRIWHDPRRGASTRQRAWELIETFALELDLEAQVGALPLGRRQNVELLKALLAEPRLLILDEPTAILTPEEVARLFTFLRRLRGQGTAVVLIAHKLAEVLALSDEITVLRGGRRIAHRLRAETDADELAALMIGSASGATVAARGDRRPPPPAPAPTRRPVAWLKAVGLAPDRPGGRAPLCAVSLALHPGEILGVAGIDGNGQRELFAVLTGDRLPDTGAIEILDHDNLAALSVAERNALGLRRVSEDRHHDGLALDLPILDNFVLQYVGRAPFSRRGWLRRGTWRETGQTLRERFAIAAPSLDRPVRTLSGGNQQKVILARELREPARLLVVAQPTRGLDFNAARFVEDRLRAAAGAGTAVILISGDLDELLALSHRIGVLHRGRWMGTVPNSAGARGVVGRMMAGHTDEVAETAEGGPS